MKMDALSLLPGSGVTRRQALKLLAAGLSAGVAGCRAAENIVPYVQQPEFLVAGALLQFATALPLGGYGRGVLASSVDGRPIKISGNPLHPASLGATDIFAEADILALYDPDRSRTPMQGSEPRGWENFISQLTPRLEALRAQGGRGFALLTARITSPTLLRQLTELRSIFPEMRWSRYEPLQDDNSRQGARLAFGRPLTLVPRLDRADVILALAADPLGHGPDQIRSGRAFASGRKVRTEQRRMSRLYSVESTMTLTGAMADHRLALGPAEISAFAEELASSFGATGGAPGANNAFLDAVANDLKAHAGRALVLAGEEQPPEIHALVHWINGQLGAFGTTADLIEPIDPVAEDHGESLAAMVRDLADGNVDTLAILGCNPAYDTPGLLRFGEQIGRADFSVHFGPYRDETAQLCSWHVPESHPLESWTDLRAFEGTAAIVQPLIVPLYATKTGSEFLAAFAGQPAASARDLVRGTWATQGGADFETWWQRVLHDGVVPQSAAPPLSPPPVSKNPQPFAPPTASGSGLVLLFQPDPSVWDGRYANNAWLQECPKPITHETWSNALRMAKADADRLGLASGDAVRISIGADEVEAPILVVSGLAPGTLALSLGYGRRTAGAIGTALGVDAYRLRPADQAWTVDGVTIEKLGRAEDMPITQMVLDADGRDILRRTSLAELAAGPAAPPEKPTSFYEEQPYEKPGGDYAWAMVIDNSLCIGCNACVVACQSENNVPVVGPDEIVAGRTMHWLRIDTYESGEAAAAQPGFQPVPCMHCEKAPCEPVCPVGASVHDHEGLNVQVYNRCVGTRFCQANCPYKVRRFNFFGYANGQEYANLGEPPLNARHNPDVTVRARGVMEKCTYCVQRISGARRDAESEDRRIRDGEVVPACASACPTEAIAFGDLNTPGSNVLGLRREPQHYALLEEVGTRPRTTYLGRVSNPNPALGDTRA